MPPLVFEPILRCARWGGRRLGTLLGKAIGTETDYAESWELAHQQNADSVVDGGPFDGQSMSQLLARHAEQIFGRQSSLSQFPLLIKFLDANDWLSLQVHPNDEQAKVYGADQNGKTEAWVILEAQPDSRICTGYRPGLTADEIRHRLNNSTIEECLHLISVKPGDCVFVTAGTVHALGPGIVLAEIQQQSDLTFRLYDWGRMGTDGNPRPLHIEQAMECTRLEEDPVLPVTPQVLQAGSHRIEELVSCEHFSIRRHSASVPFQLKGSGAFSILIVLESGVVLEWDGDFRNLPFGTTALIPAACSDVTVIPRNGRIAILEIDRPEY